MIAAPWLSAHLVITVLTELTYYFWSFAAVVVGFYFINRQEALMRTGRKRYVRLVISTCAIPFVLGGGLTAGDSFAYWKLRSISQSGWEQMASDLEKQAAGMDTPEGRIKWADLPDSLRQLGRREDCRVIEAESITFGNRTRVWGLCLNDGKRPRVLYKGVRKVPVAESAVFFIGSND